MRLLFIILFFFIASKSYASCVQVALLDDSDSVVGKAGLVTAIKLDGKTLVYLSELPKHTKKKEIGIVSCPREIRESVEGLYNIWCRSPQSMQQVAIDNQQSILVVQNRCSVLEGIIQIPTKPRKLF
jgi:hypothetical protein